MKEIDASSSKDEAATGSMMGLELPACMHLHLHCPSPNVNAKAEILRWQTPARMEIREYKLHEVEIDASSSKDEAETGSMMEGDDGVRVAGMHAFALSKPQC
ncbi:hypothetical protein V6N13_106688 [Hibiscus sabdariffa]